MPGTRRSKGCVSCIRRKIKCDERKPSCKRCLDSRLSCEGYQRPPRWVDENIRFQNSTNKSLSSISTETAEVLKLALSRSDSPSVGLLADEDGVYIEFMREYLVKSFSWGARGFSYSDWVTECIQKDAEDPSNLAVKALAAAFFARLNGSPANATMKRNQMYYHAGKNLRRSLENSTELSSSSAVSTTMALHFLEMITFNDETMFLHHAGGVSRLIKSRGPAQYQEYPDHAVFLFSRMAILHEEAIRGHPGFLGEDAWLTIPWNKHPETKTPLQQILDIAAKAPQTQPLLYRAMHMTNNLPAVIEQVAYELGQLVRELIHWRWDWEIRNPTAVKEERVNPVDTIYTTRTGDLLFETKLVYDTFEHVLELCYYNLCISMANFHAAQLHRPLLVDKILEEMESERNVEPSNPATFPKPGVCVGALGHVDNCRSFEYALAPQHPKLAAYCMAAPLRITFFSLAINDAAPAYREWLNGIMDLCVERSGFAIFERLKYFPPFGYDKNMDVNELFEVLKREAKKQDLSEPIHPVPGVLAASEGPYNIGGARRSSYAKDMSRAHLETYEPNPFVMDMFPDGLRRL